MASDKLEKAAEVVKATLPKEKKVDKIDKVKFTDIERAGTQFVMPEGMEYEDAIALLKRRMEFEEEKTSIKETINTFPWDGAFALQKAMKEIFGWFTPETVKTFFGDVPPSLISVETDYEKTELVMWGRITLPGISGHLDTKVNMVDGHIVFMLDAIVKRKHEPVIRKLVARTREIVAKESIYRGKAFKVRFRDEDGDEKPMPEPRFLDLSQVKDAEILFSKDVMDAVSTSLFTPVERAAECRQYGIPLKRGVLLSGPYGTGKTLAAYVTAKKCIENGFTFLYCERADELHKMVKLAHQYQPAVIFCEDIDRAMSGDRSVSIDDILNIIDGIESKKTEIMVILTTNHVERINQAMLRPGRLDAVIHVAPPDAVTVQRLIRLYGRGLVSEEENLGEVGKELAGRIPAVIRECVERAKLSALRRMAPGEAFGITAEALLESAKSMRVQLELLEGKKSNVDEAKVKAVAAELGRSMENMVGIITKDGREVSPRLKASTGRRVAPRASGVPTIYGSHQESQRRNVQGVSREERGISERPVSSVHGPAFRRVLRGPWSVPGLLRMGGRRCRK